MLQIDIIGIDNSTGGLILEENGRPNNGHSRAHKCEDVHWKVKGHCGVDHIDGIIWKPISGSTDVFSSHRPAPQTGTQKKHWKGTVNCNAQEYSVYIYSIEWVHEDGGPPRTFDPIISIKPSKFALTELATFFLGVGISLLFSRKKKSSK